MSRNKTSTVKREIFISSLIFLTITMTLFSVFFAKTLYQTEMAKAKNVIQQRNSAINFFIDGYFKEIKSTINILAMDYEIQNATQLDTMGKQKILEKYRNYAQNNKQITYIYSGYSNGLLLINDYFPPENYNLTSRPWYRSAIAAKPGISIGVPYQDAIDKEWLISTGKAFVGERTKHIGVVAIDSSIQMIADSLAKRSLGYKSSYSYILNQDQKAIIHHNEKYMNKYFSDVVQTTEILDKQKGDFVYTVDGIKKRAYYSRIPETGWTIITVVETQEIILPIILQIVLTVLIPVLIAFMFAVWQSRILSRRFSKPLFKLHKEISAVISGDKAEPSDNWYPDNEIGLIAREIENVTEKELYKRALELEEANKNLNITLEELSTLQGIIPICSSCKNIRDDEGSWNKLESYIEKHSEAAFSHGICPDCMEKLYGEDEWYKKRKGKKKE